MSSKSVLPLLAEMVYAYHKTLAYTEGIEEGAFAASTFVQDAVAMNLEVVVEMANRLPHSYRQAHTAIPWHQLVALRNVIAHGYASVDQARIWQIVRNELPPLALELERLSQTENDPS